MQRISILGLGLIGGSMGLALKRSWPEGQIAGYDLREEASRIASQRKAIDRIAPSPEEAIADADLIIIATPPLAVGEVLRQIAPCLPAGAVVTDTASTKERVLAWAEELLPPGVSFVGGHPMAGKETQGMEAAEADLFRGCTYCLVPAATATSDATSAVVALVEGIGARPFFLDAAQHDKLVAGISHLPLVVSAALTSALTGDPSWSKMAPLAAGGFRDTSRLASGDPIMKRDICLSNRDNLLEWLEIYFEELREYQRLIREERGGELEETFHRACKARLEWLEAFSKGT